MDEPWTGNRGIRDDLFSARRRGGGRSGGGPVASSRPDSRRDGERVRLLPPRLWTEFRRFTHSAGNWTAPCEAPTSLGPR